MTERPRVLFLCVHNAGRSQAAAALMKYHGGGKVKVMSAGSEPAEIVNPSVVLALKERGIDISAEIPRHWTDADIEVADVVITMGCGDTCPILPGKQYLDWEVDDPSGRGLDEVRDIVSDIYSRVTKLLVDLGVETQGGET